MRLRRGTPTPRLRDGAGEGEPDDTRWRWGSAELRVLLIDATATGQPHDWNLGTISGSDRESLGSSLGSSPHSDPPTGQVVLIGEQEP